MDAVILHYQHASLPSYVNSKGANLRLLSSGGSGGHPFRIDFQPPSVPGDTCDSASATVNSMMKGHEIDREAAEDRRVEKLTGSGVWCRKEGWADGEVRVETVRLNGELILVVGPHGPQFSPSSA